MRTRWIASATAVTTLLLLFGVHAQTPQYGTDDDFGYGATLTPEQREGRNTWYFWTGGNQKFWVKMAELTEGNVNLLAYVDSRLYGRRFATLGAITQPGCRPATGPDKYGLWMDACDQPPVPGIELSTGAPTGIVGLRRFDNPDFDPASWNAETYLTNPGKMQPPYLVGMACGFCHIGFNPLNPPDNPELPRWANLAGAIGNQFWEEGRLFYLRMPPTDFRWHVGNRQPAGTSDTSRFATDHINNPNSINAIFNLEFRPTQIEQMADGSMVPVHHILKEGADSIGIAGASLRVFVNIGMCSDYWLTLHDPVNGRTPQKPFDIAHARANCADWRSTEARMPNAEAFLKTLRPMRLSDAPGGAAYITADAATLHRGKIAFADKCARCHSSKQPPAEVAADLARATMWYRESVLAEDFLDRNFLSDDRRYPVSMLGTNIARAAATNATAQGVWAQFSSATYKNQPAIGRIRNLYNPQDPDDPIEFDLKGGGRGYYRTPTIISMWATAPYLHNNALGTYIKDPSVRARMLAFQDAAEKLLWPERRLGVQSIPVTTIDTELKIPGRNRPLRIPAGTPVDLIARVDPREVPRIARSRIVLNVLSDGALFRGLVRDNQAPDFVLDRGHEFGAELLDDDKRALIEFLKTF
jgi:mono/diheme cytochrome c family protein